jgi:hypothetical protein
MPYFKVRYYPLLSGDIQEKYLAGFPKHSLYIRIQYRQDFRFCIYFL